MPSAATGDVGMAVTNVKKKKLSMKRFRNLGRFSDCLPLIAEMIFNDLVEFVTPLHRRRLREGISQGFIYSNEVGVFPELRNRMRVVMMMLYVNRACRMHLGGCWRALCEREMNFYAKSMVDWKNAPGGQLLRYKPIYVSMMDTILCLFQRSGSLKNQALVGSSGPMVQKYFYTESERRMQQSYRGVLRMRSPFSYLMVCLSGKCQCCMGDTDEPVLMGSIGKRLCRVCKRNLLISNYTLEMRYGFRALRNSKCLMDGHIQVSEIEPQRWMNVLSTIDPYLKNMKGSCTLTEATIHWVYMPSLRSAFGDEKLERMAAVTKDAREKFYNVAMHVKKVTAQRYYRELLIETERQQRFEKTAAFTSMEIRNRRPVWGPSREGMGRLDLTRLPSITIMRRFYAKTVESKYGGVGNWNYAIDRNPTAIHQTFPVQAYVGYNSYPNVCEFWMD